MDLKLLPENVTTRIRSSTRITTFLQCIAELVFNSIDSKATAVAVRVNALSFQIQVVDNGNGISFRNIQSVGVRYMTNKCYSLKDFVRKPKYYGHRGETLASIQGFSKVLNIISRTEENSETFSKTFHSNSPPQINVVKQRSSKGTTINIEGFLYNCPVRQKRVNANIELDEVKKLLKSLAIVHPNISFSLRNDITGNIIFNCHKTNAVSESISRFYCDIDVDAFEEIKVTKDTTFLSGLIYTKFYGDNKLQLVYINRRPVLSEDFQKLINTKLLNSIRSLYCTMDTSEKILKSIEPKDVHPAYVINISCPYSDIDLMLISYKCFVQFKNLHVVLKILEKVLSNVMEKLKLQEGKDVVNSVCSGKVKRKVAVNNSVGKKLKRDTKLEYKGNFVNKEYENLNFNSGPKLKNSEIMEHFEILDTESNSKRNKIIANILPNKVRKFGGRNKMTNENSNRNISPSEENLAFDQGLSAKRITYNQRTHEDNQITCKTIDDVETFSSRSADILFDQNAEGKVTVKDADKVKRKVVNNSVGKKLKRNIKLECKGNFINQQYEKLNLNLRPQLKNSEIMEHFEILDTESDSERNKIIPNILPNKIRKFGVRNKMKKENSNRNSLSSEGNFALDHGLSAKRIIYNQRTHEENQITRKTIEDVQTFSSRPADIILFDQNAGKENAGNFNKQEGKDAVTSVCSGKVKRKVVNNSVGKKLKRNIKLACKGNFINKQYEKLILNLRPKLKNSEIMEHFEILNTESNSEKNRIISNILPNKIRKFGGRNKMKKENSNRNILPLGGNLAFDQGLSAKRITYNQRTHEENQITCKTIEDERQTFSSRPADIILFDQNAEGKDAVTSSVCSGKVKRKIAVNNSVDKKLKRDIKLECKENFVNKEYENLNFNLRPKFKNSEIIEHFEILDTESNSEKNMLPNNIRKFGGRNKMNKENSNRNMLPLEENLAFDQGLSAKRITYNQRAHEENQITCKAIEDEKQTFSSRPADIILFDQNAGKKFIMDVFLKSLPNYEDRKQHTNTVQLVVTETLWQNLAENANRNTTVSLHIKTQKMTKNDMTREMNRTYKDSTMNNLLYDISFAIGSLKKRQLEKLNSGGNLIISNRLNNKNLVQYESECKSLLTSFVKNKRNLPKMISKQVQTNFPIHSCSKNNVTEILSNTDQMREQTLVSTNKLMFQNNFGIKNSRWYSVVDSNSPIDFHKSNKFTFKLRPIIQNEHLVKRISQSGGKNFSSFLMCKKFGVDNRYDTHIPSLKDPEMLTLNTFCNSSAFHLNGRNRNGTHNKNWNSLNSCPEECKVFLNDFDSDGHRIFNVDSKGQNYFQNCNDFKNVTHALYFDKESTFKSHYNTRKSIQIIPRSKNKVEIKDHGYKSIFKNSLQISSNIYKNNIDFKLFAKINPNSICKSLYSISNCDKHHHTEEVENISPILSLKPRTSEVEGLQNDTKLINFANKCIDMQTNEYKDTIYALSCSTPHMLLRKKDVRRDYICKSNLDENYEALKNVSFWSKDFCHMTFPEFLIHPKKTKNRKVNDKHKRTMETTKARNCNTLSTIHLDSFTIDQINFRNINQSKSISKCVKSIENLELQSNNESVMRIEEITYGNFQTEFKSTQEENTSIREDLNIGLDVQDLAAMDQIHIGVNNDKESEHSKAKADMTFCWSPENKPEFVFKKRPEFIPKGLSPIMNEISPFKLSLSSSEKKELQCAIIKTYEHEMKTVKWKYYIDEEDPNKFFEKFYDEKQKQFGIEVTDLNNKYSLHETYSFSKEVFKNLEVIGQLDCKFIVTVSKSSLIILFDQHAVHERIRLESLLEDYIVQSVGQGSTKCNSTRCDVPLHLKLSETDICILTNFKDLFENMGLIFETFDDHILVKAIPTCFYNKSCKYTCSKEKHLTYLVQNLIADEIIMLETTRGCCSKIPKLIQHIINSESCRGAVKFGEILTQSDCSTYVSKLSRCKLPFQCAHGRPTLVPIVEIAGVNETVKKKSTPNLKKLLAFNNSRNLWKV